MMRVDYIRDAPRRPGSKVKVGGRIIRIKDLKSAKFVWVRDVTGSMQITVMKESTDPKLMKRVEELIPNDFIVVEGTVPREIKAAFGSEVTPTRIEIVGKALTTAPIDIDGFNESSFDKRLDWRALDLRNPRQLAIFKVQSKLLEAMRKYLYSQGFMETFTPSLMGVSSEGGSEVFSLRHFGKTAYLRQDPQLHRELLMLAGFERVYEIGPSWRAEPSNTPRHLTEHRTCAAEISFIEDERDVMRVEENLIMNAVKAVVNECEDELKLLRVELKAPRLPLPVLEFPAIYDTLDELGVKVERGDDYNREAEMALGRYVREKHHSDFFFVNRFPYAVKPFYVMRVDDEPEWARSTDLLYKGLEMSSGGQREHRYEKIIEQAKGKAMDLDNLKWFTDFFKYGAPPHGGFSLGIERLTMQLLNLLSVRETTLFPRAPDRLVP